MCTSSEVASQQVKKIQGVESKQTEEVKKLGEKKKTARKPHPKKEAEKQAKSDDKSKKPTSSDKCRYCGRQQRHVRKTECPAFGQRCSKCQKKGHFASVCYASKKVHQSEGSPVSSSDDSCLRVETVSLVQTKAKQSFADIKFFKSAQENFTTALACQLDTGATCNVISLDDLSATAQLGEPPLNESSVKLKLFGGSTMKPIGECSLQIKHNGTRKSLQFQVVKDKCKPLLSAETCEKLQLIKLNTDITDSVHQVNDSSVQDSLSKEKLMNKYHDVFSGLGHIGDAKIVIDKSVTPVQHSPRRVPVALQKDVKKKIRELEEKGIIAKAVEPSEWISSMVVVTKPSKIRICLDPKDLNQAVQRPKFQMPTLEELFPN